MTSATPIVLRAPADLRPHPLNTQMPRWDRESSEWLAFLADIEAHGIKTPIRITAANQVVDGETRRLAARALNLASVPCVVVEGDEVAGTMLRELQLRRNLTKGQRAYLSVPLLEPVLEEARKRQVARLKRGSESPSDDSVVPRENIGDFGTFAHSLGFSHDLLNQARRLHEAFTQEPALKEQFEPQILSFDDPIGLGACLAGIAGQKATKDQEKRHRADEQLHLFTAGWAVVGKRLGYWTKLGDDDRRAAIPVLRQTVAAMPADLRDELRKALKAAGKEEAAASQ